jgi:hypothetical protein
MVGLQFSISVLVFFETVGVWMVDVFLVWGQQNRMIALQRQA